MKTTITTVILTLFITLTSVAQTFTDNGLNYNVLSINPNQVEVTGGTFANPLTIPSTASDGTDTYTVTTIGDEAFRSKDVTSVIFPNTITTIKYRAFRENGGLTSITLPASVTSVGGEAFFRSGLNKIIAEGTIPASISNSSFGTRSNVDLIVPKELGETYRLAGWTGFKSLNGEVPIGEVFNVEDLQYRITSKSPNEVEVANVLNGIQDVVIPAAAVEPQFGETFAVTGVGNRAFKNAGINNVVFSNTIKIIKNEAFENNNLTTVTFPAILTSINARTFIGNPLTEVISQAIAAPTLESSSIENRGDIALTLPNGSEALYENAGWTGFFSINGEFQVGAQFTQGDFRYEITNVNPNEVKVLNRVTTEQNITIPATVSASGVTFNVTTIENNAFQNTDVTSVVIGSNVLTIGNNAFQGSLLTTIEAQGTTPAKIEDNSFGESGNINLIIPASSLTDYENAGWTGFFSVNGSGPSVGTRFTVNAIQYEILTLAPNTLSAVGKDGTVPNGDFVFPELISKNGFDFTITTIGNSAFRNQNVKTISLPSSITTLAFRAFRDNSFLRNVNIPANITSIGVEAFFDNGLTEIISESVNPPIINNGTIDPRSDINLFIPEGTTQAYIDANWTGFKSIIEVGTLLTVEPKIYLQGASLNPNTGEETLMRDDLRIANLIPTTSPYTDGATCDSAVFNKTGDDAIVDWVFVELREATNNTIIVEGKSALLQRDGDVVDVNGKSILQFISPQGNYFVAIKHRNHLGIMTGNVISLTGNRNTIDFTTNVDTLISGGANAVAEISTGVFALLGGDLDSNTQIQNSDLNDLVLVLGSNAGYSNADLDMNGQIQNTDINNIVNPNLGKGQQFTTSEE